MLYLRIIFTLLIFFIININASYALDMFFSREPNPPLALKLPVSCQLEESCWLVNYPDVQKEEGYQDYKGGKNTYEGNKGTYFAVKTFIDIKNGTPAHAADDGKVIFVRNNIEDNYPLGDKDTEKEPPFCGNAVVIEHNHGWKTAYCHLKKGSISVKQGDFTTAGAQIGQIGLSGQTEFPHLYFTVLKGENYFDPFSGLQLNGKENKNKYKPLWGINARDNLKYRDVILTNIGVSAEDPSLYSVKQGSYKNIELLYDEPEIFIWVYGFHFKKKDIIKLTLYNPDQEKVMNDFIRVSSGNIENLVSFKKKKKKEKWKPGFYNVKINYIKTGLKLAYEYNFNFEIKKPPEPIDKEEIKRLEKLKKRMLERRKIIIYKKLKDEKKLPDTFKKQEFKFLNE